MATNAGSYIFLIKLSNDNDTAKLAGHCLAQGFVLLAPSNAFSQAQNTQIFMCFDVAQVADARIYEVLGKVLNGMT